MGWPIGALTYGVFLSLLIIYIQNLPFAEVESQSTEIKGWVALPCHCLPLPCHSAAMRQQGRGMWRGHEFVPRRDVGSAEVSEDVQEQIWM